MTKIGFVGTGGFTKHHINILKEINDMEIVGFVGSSQEKATQFAENYPGTKGYDSLESMLEEERVDAVYICVPPMAHKNYEEILIQHEVPFLVEKPLGVEESEVRHIKKAVEQSNHLTSVGYHFRYADSVQQLQQKLAGANTGIVTGKWMGSMPGVYWWKNQAQSGGQFNEQTTHMVDLIRYLFGEVASVYAQETKMVKEDPSVTVADAGTFVLTLENGLTVQISNTAVLPDGTGEVGLSIYTDEGIISWNPDHLQVTTPDHSEKIKMEKNPYVTESEAFLHAVKTGDRSHVLSSYQDAWGSFKVALAARRSIEEKRQVQLTEIED